MNSLHRLYLKLTRRRRMEHDIEAELAFHRELAEAHGNPVPLGNTTLLKEQARDLWRFTWIENLWRDVLYAARGLRRSRSLVVSGLLSLGLGIGVNTALFSLAMEFLLSEPSITDPASLAAMRVGGNSHSTKQIVEFVRESGVFAEVVGDNEESFVNWNDGTETRRLFSAQATRNYFTALGIPVQRGRGWREDETGDYVVVSHRFWTKNLQSDPAAIGRALNLEGRAHTIVGILPANHRTLTGFGLSPDVYLPIAREAAPVLALYARLKPGMSLPEARSALNVLGQRLNKAFPGDLDYAQGCRADGVVGIERLQGQNMLPVELFFLLLLSVVSLVLLIACVNVASLLLARASTRRQEFAVRLSLGASQGRLLQQLLVESLLLSLLGAAAGLGLRYALALLLEQVTLPVPVPIRLHLELDTRVAWYAGLLVVATTLACGLLPAWQTIRESIASHLPRDSKLRLRRGLVVAQLALSVLVLSTGLLFLRNLAQASGISPGFDVHHTVGATVYLPPAKYKDAAHKKAFVSAALSELSSIPGIDAAAAARTFPFLDSSTFQVDLVLSRTGERQRARFHLNQVSRDYFRALSIPVLRGETFAASGIDPVVKPVIVNRTFVSRYLGAREPLGTVVSWDSKGQQRVIIGVVGDTKTMTIGEDDQPQLYDALTEIGANQRLLQFVVRSQTPPLGQVEAVRQAIRKVEPDAGLEVAPVYSRIGLAFLPSQIGAALLGSIGVVGLLLAVVGLYGVMVYSVTRRTREIGIRMAIGADRRTVSRMVLADAARLVAWGAGLGLVVAVFVLKPLTMFLVPGLRPTDPVTLGSVVLVLAATGVVAAWGPVRRAARIEPMICLRYE